MIVLTSRLARASGRNVSHHRFYSGCINMCESFKMYSERTVPVIVRDPECESKYH